MKGSRIPLLLILLAPLTVFGGSRELQARMLGVWIPDVEASIEYYRDSPQAAELTSRQLEADIKKMKRFLKQASLEIHIRENEIALAKTDQTEARPYRIRMATGAIVKLLCPKISEHEHRAQEFTLRFIDKKRMMINSNKNKDLDLYVFKKIKSYKKAEDS